MKKVFNCILCFVIISIFCNYCICFADTTENEESIETEEELDEEMAFVYDHHVRPIFPQTFYKNSWDYNNNVVEMRKKAEYWELPVYIDGEEQSKKLRMYKFNSISLNDMYNFRDVLEIFGGKLSFSPHNTVSKGTPWSGSYKWGSLVIAGKEYMMYGFRDLSKESLKFTDCFVIKVGEEENLYNIFKFLPFPFSDLYVYFINGEMYIPIHSIYYIATKNYKMFNFDNDSFNIKSYDEDKEEALKLKYFPQEGYPVYNSEYYDKESYYEEVNDEFIGAFDSVQISIDPEFSIGHSISEKEAYKYCKLIYEGYGDTLMNYDFNMDYNEELGAYVIYNKEYSNDNYDKNLRLAAIRAYDGKLIYATRVYPKEEYKNNKWRISPN